MPFTKAPRWYLTPTPLTLGKRGGVLLKYPGTFPPVRAVIMVPRAVPGLQGTRASGKGELALGCALRKNSVKYLWDVFRMTNRQPVTINLSLCPVHLAYMNRHRFRHKFYYIVQAGDLSSQLILVRCPPSCSPPSYLLLQHPGHECAWMEYRGLGIKNIFYQSVPA